MLKYYPNTKDSVAKLIATIMSPTTAPDVREQIVRFMVQERKDLRFFIQSISPASITATWAINRLSRTELPRNVREDTARKILARLSGRVHLAPGDEQKPEPVLESLATAYRARARFG